MRPKETLRPAALSMAEFSCGVSVPVGDSCHEQSVVRNSSWLWSVFTHRPSAFIVLLKESQITKSFLNSSYCALQLTPKKATLGQ